MKRHISYFKYVCRHKRFVYEECRKLGVPWLQAVLHDWTKFTPGEWLPYADTFYAADGSKRYLHTVLFDIAWNSHQKRNKHHWQYWVLLKDNGTEQCLPIPERYIREMLADWVGAGRAINGYVEVADWYQKNKEKMKLHFEARIMIEFLMKTHYPPVREDEEDE